MDGGLESARDGRLAFPTVVSNGPINMSFPNQFQIGNPENEPRKLEIHFNDLLVESIHRQSSQQVKKQKNSDGERKKLEHQRIIYRMKAMVNLIRKQEKIHKSVMNCHDLGGGCLAFVVLEHMAFCYDSSPCAPLSSWSCSAHLVILFANSPFPPALYSILIISLLSCPRVCCLLSVRMHLF